MAPRKEGEGTLSVAATMADAAPTPTTSLASSSSASFVDSFYPTRNSSLWIKHTSSSASSTGGESAEVPMDGADAFNQGRAASIGRSHTTTQDIKQALEAIAQRGDELINLSARSNQSNDAPITESAGSDLLVEACYDSLQKEAKALLAEANTLLESADNNETMQKRAAIAQARAETYLDTVHEAMQHPARESIGMELSAMNERLSIGSPVRSVPTESTSGKEQIKSPIMISSWRAPSLAFDFTIGEAVTTVIKGGFPLKVSVKLIAEVHAGAGGSTTPLPEHRACLLSFDQSTSRHDMLEYRAAGRMGDALIKVHLFPILDAKTQTSTGVWRSDTTDVKSLSVSEARSVQVNATPPRSKSTVDLYTTNVYGDFSSSVILRFHTFTTGKEAVMPEVQIELLAGSA